MAFIWTNLKPLEFEAFPSKLWKLQNPKSGQEKTHKILPVFVYSEEL